MKKQLIVLSLTLILVNACQQQEEQPPPVEQPVMTETSATTTSAPIDSARRITLEEATSALARGDAVLIDVRSGEAYNASHARGAIHIPEAEIINRLADIPMGKMIITYCT